MNNLQIEEGKILKKYGLNNLLMTNGLPNPAKFRPFILMNSYATSKSDFVNNSKAKLVENANPDLYKNVKTALTTDLDEFQWYNPFDYFGLYDKIYQGTVFIPISTNIQQSVDSVGKDQVSVDNA